VTEPRIAPLPVTSWDDDVRSALHQAFPESVVDRFVADGAPTAISTMLHHPALAGPWLAYNNVLLWAPALDHRLRELIVLRVASRTGSPYEWEQHVALSRRYGVTPADIEVVRTGVGSEALSPLERDLLTATDELIDDYRIGDETWQRLADQLDERQLVETVFVVGTYTCLAMAFNSFGLGNDDR
jgi:alkylhydroperoxidase family enzyme